MMGLEPTTFCMASRRSSQLSYIRERGQYSRAFQELSPARLGSRSWSSTGIHSSCSCGRPTRATCPRRSSTGSRTRTSRTSLGWAEGYVIAAGPFTDQDDELRGFAVLSCDPDKARELYASDPAVRAGRLGVEVLTWMIPKGNVRFAQVARPRSTAEAR